MPRKPRILSSTGIYHITLRSINQHIIFEEESDYQKFLYILSDCKTKYDIDIFAYCLMDNHIHLLLRSPQANLSSFFQSLGSRFVRWYNTKYSRFGHLFQERYFSAPVDTTEYYLNTLLYIHNNPVKAGACRFPTEYRWSSAAAFYGKKDPLLNLSFSYEIAGTKDLLLKLFAENISPTEDFFAGLNYQPKHYLTDEQALAIFKSITNLATTSEANTLTKIERNHYIRLLRNEKLSYRQIARLMDVSVTTVRRLCTK